MSASENMRSDPPSSHSASPAQGIAALSFSDSPSHKGFRVGTHRLVSPGLTLERMHPHLSAMGITRIANVTGLDRIGIPVVTVCRPNSRSLAVAQGKGLTLAAARASGLMESIEGYHAENIDMPLRRGSWRQLRRTDRLIEVDRLPQSPGSPFHPDLPLWWVEGFDILSDHSLWLPLETVYLDFRVDQRDGCGCFVVSSKGLAGGNHLLEAVSHAICELVEQDAFLRWRLADFPEACRTRLDLERIGDRQIQGVLERFRRAGVDVAVWEITSAVAIPGFYCTILDAPDSPGPWLYSASGFGCHPVREIALLRALVEAAQSRLTAISGSRDDLDRAQYLHHRDPAVIRQQRQSIESHGPGRTLAEAPSMDSDDFAADVVWELERLRSVGIGHVAMVNLTKPGLGIPVVRVVIPGLMALGPLPPQHPSRDREGAAPERQP